MIECAVWWATPLDDIERFRSWLTRAEAERFAAYRQEADRRRFLTGRVLAKSVLAERLGLPSGAIELDASCPDCAKQHGPPRLPGFDVALSISHSGDRIGLAVTNGCPVGLDVESTARRADDALAAYALNETELAELGELPEQRRDGAFFTYWTRKEALMKATGRGLRIALRGITLSPPGEPARLVSATDEALRPQGAKLADLDPGDGYSAAVAMLDAPAHERLTVRERWWDLGSGLQPHRAQQGYELG